jgi:hypothetical protein
VARSRGLPAECLDRSDPVVEPATPTVQSRHGWVDERGPRFRRKGALSRDARVDHGAHGNVHRGCSERRAALVGKRSRRLYFLIGFRYVFRR